MFLCILFRARLITFFLLVLCVLPALAAPPNIILITLDTTRADRMGFLGSQAGLTPNLDAFAKNAIVFTHAYSQVPLTTASHATILTGTYPQFHKVSDAGMALAKTVPYAPQVLRGSGYQTAAFVGSVILDPAAGAPGFDRGFTTYDAGFRARGAQESRYQTLERRADDVVARAVAWVDKHSQKPFFLWIHLYDPHAPYDPPEPFRSRYATAPYDGEIAYTDSVVGKFLNHLSNKKLSDDAIIAVMADHGESLGEHGERGHGVFLYDPTIHVPLVIKLPKNKSAGERIDSPAELVDVLPTLLQSAAVPIPAAIQGKPLLNRSAGKQDGQSADRAYSETEYPQRAFGWSSLRALRTGKYLFVAAPRRELYDETKDPGEQNNLAADSRALADTISAQLERMRIKTASSAAVAKSSLDPQQEANLKALGYVSNGNSGGRSVTSDTDPKDRIEIANLMTEANLQSEQGDYSQAVAKLQQVVAKDPGLAPAYSALGAAWIATGNYSEALPPLRKAVELHPESSTAHYQLGMGFFGSGDLNSAASEFEMAVKQSPESADTHYSLASVYVRVGRMRDAVRELQASLRIQPNLYPANLMLGQVYVVEKIPAASLPYLRKAATLNPQAPDPHGLLAEAYAQLGQKQNADREQRSARALSAKH